MYRSLPVVKVRADLGILLTDIERNSSVFTITRRGNPVAVLLSVDRYDELTELERVERGEA